MARVPGARKVAVSVARWTALILRGVLSAVFAIVMVRSASTPGGFLNLAEWVADSAMLRA